MVDYALVSESLLDHIPCFYVKRFMADISDHCCIAFRINFPTIPSERNHETIFPFPTTYKWCEESAQDYVQILASPPIMKEINAFLQTSFNLDQTGISVATDQITDIFKLAAAKTLRQTPSTRKRKHNSTPWYNRSLKYQRINLRAKGALLSKFPHDPVVRGKFFKSLKVL